MPDFLLVRIDSNQIYAEELEPSPPDKIWIKAVLQIIGGIIRGRSNVK
jgi:hypothetical protein